MSTARRFLDLSLLILAFSFSGCDKSDPKDLPEWTPADHDNQQNDTQSPSPNQVDPKKPRGTMPSLEQYGITDVILATWKQSCVPCHGVIGRGDGPQGAAVRPRDLTDPKWQRVAIDSEMAHAIKNGRGRMPGFAQLPDETIQGLVRLVRLLNADPNRTSAPEAAPGPSDDQSSSKKSEGQAPTVPSPSPSTDSSSDPGSKPVQP